MRRADTTETGWQGGQYRPLTDADAAKIIDGAYQILEKAGVRMASRIGFDALKAAGAQVDEGTRIVRMSRGLIEDSLASAPSTVTLYGREPRYDCVLHDRRVHVGTGGTALYVLDRETGQRRPSTLIDVADCARLCDALEYVHVFTINVFPGEIKNIHDIDVNRFYWSLKNTSKHVMGGVYSREGTEQVVDMCRLLAGGADALRARPFVSFITLIISPLKVDSLYGDVACYLAQQGIPVVTPTEPICGTTSPVTLAGNTLLHVAETLAGVVMVQSVRKGAPVICGSVGSIADLRIAQHLSGAVERALMNSAVAQVIQKLEVPLYSTAGTSDAKIVYAQAAYESALSNLLVTMSGANYVHDACGLMDFDLTVAYEKMVLDNEILGMCARAMRGIEVTDETLAVDLICERGPGEDYLAEEHTIYHMRREFYSPTISDRRPRSEWESAGATDATERARRRVRQLLASHQPCPIDVDRDSAVRQRFPSIIELQQ